ncbi:MAG: hypothetical protein ACREDH_00215 [Methylocella sp.]
MTVHKLSAPRFFRTVAECGISYISHRTPAAQGRIKEKLCGRRFIDRSASMTKTH